MVTGVVIIYPVMLMQDLHIQDWDEIGFHSWSNGSLLMLLETRSVVH